ncbi:MAG: tRNA uridine-5-carboxymethylaminomethyl(34) synthesis GTPase MnmE [Candidatus Omnitrophica bacterium]|nr:tRNA uridine-5-carboxymethylaminomethyl(34) synthesis GTPase MnmE [Candidatus Omnitrophota bacterium]HOX54281.1 tRNA uridine-5-carboxymethylaminomethyl(34) synthesis GTPase MnmE [Candidatus Omnitrophota bacterium]
MVKKDKTINTSKFGLNDTIAAVSTPLGQAGIGIVRLSGKDSLSIADKIFISREKNKPSKFKTYTTHYGWICENGKGKIIDEVIMTVMRSPKSYTKEDIVEINCHSGFLPLKKILNIAVKMGARLAEPGEFTRRAFINGRIDLAQAEAVLDIINAKTDSALEIGVSQLKGELSKKIEEIRNGLVEVLAYLEASIDFPEEDIDKLSLKQQTKHLVLAKRNIESLLESSEHGKIMREGIDVVICGKPNVGKSSLLNTLIKEEKAIVTHIPGTTRDIVEEVINLKGIPLRFVDTAGIIEPKDLVEKEAIKRSRKQLENCDLALFVLDNHQKISNQDKNLINNLKGKNIIFVVNKIDLSSKINIKTLKSLAKNSTIVKISALHKLGIRDLEDAIIKNIWQGRFKTNKGVFISNIRHIQALRNALFETDNTLELISKKISVELICFELTSAVKELDSITGRTIEKDLLDKIFSEFCIGK